MLTVVKWTVAIILIYMVIAILLSLFGQWSLGV